MNDTLIKVENVSKKFCRNLKRSLLYGMKDLGSELIGSSNSHKDLRKDEFWANKDISFELKRGDTLGLIGRNGAGKTTLLRMLNGLIKTDIGRIEVRGRMQALIALGAGFNPILTGRENIYVNAAVLGIPKVEVDRRYDEIVDFSGIEEFIDAPVQSYSSGMAVRLGFAVAVHMKPDILVVDEVLAVGDIGFQSKCFNKMGEMRKNGVTTILVSHSMMHILGFCDNALYMDGGKIKGFGEAIQVVKNYQEDVGGVSRRTLTSFEFGIDDVEGSGKVRFTRIVFLDADKKPVNQINARDPLTVRIYYVASCNVGSAELDVAIGGSGSGMFFRASSSAFGKDFIIHEGNGYIDVDFESLRANGQSIMFYFTLWKSDRSELFDWKRELPFYVEGDSRAGGMALLNVDWTNNQ